MDIATIRDVLRPASRGQLPPWRAGDAWLAGGTWLFSEPPPGLERLIDLDGFGWPPLVQDDDGLTIAATCRIAVLRGFVPARDWPAAALFPSCCEALQSSFKIWNTATVGGNLCLSLPAGTLIALTAALEGRCVIWRPEGGERSVKVIDFVTGINRNVLRPGELLRAITIPAAALARRVAFRNATATTFGRTTALLIGTRSPSDDGVSFTLGAATQRPLRLEFRGLPDEAALCDAIAAAADGFYVDDVFATSGQRRRLALALAEEVRRELGDGTGACRSP
jgi:CO/xanthine dehydrogenase FAD-binding subunit